MKMKQARHLEDRCRGLNVELRFVERGRKRVRAADVTVMTRWTGHSHGYKAAKDGSRVVFIDAGLDRVAELVGREYRAWVAAA
ncbi:MAG: hypothetical protein ACKVS9_06160 [Phycisphaerae bacterium]